MKKKPSHFSTKKLVMLSLYTAMALVLFTVESALPALAPLPFAKIGLANVITLIVLAQYTPKDAFLVLFLRILLSSIFAGQIVSLLYSFAGGMLCFFADWVVNSLLKGKYLYITSIFGAIFHNTGQLIMAVFLLGTGILPYAPYMMVLGVITGLFTGIVADMVVKQMRQIR
jgi:heptaprenyl diphosphate synthase